MSHRVSSISQAESRTLRGGRSVRLPVEQYDRMADWIFIFIGSVFLLAGFV